MSKNFYQVSYLDMIVLKLLNDRDMYGYEIMDELSQRSQGVCDLKAGTLYPVLALLTEQDLVVPYEKYTENHRIRKIRPMPMTSIQNCLAFMSASRETGTAKSISVMYTYFRKM